MGVNCYREIIKFGFSSSPAWEMFVHLGAESQDILTLRWEALYLSCNSPSVAISRFLYYFWEGDDHAYITELFSEAIR